MLVYKDMYFYEMKYKIYSKLLELNIANEMKEFHSKECFILLDTLFFMLIVIVKHISILYNKTHI